MVLTNPGQLLCVAACKLGKAEQKWGCVRQRRTEVLSECGAVWRLGQHQQQLDKKLWPYFWKEKAECQMAVIQKNWDLNKNLKQNNKIKPYIGKKCFGVTQISLRGIKKKRSCLWCLLLFQRAHFTRYLQQKYHKTLPSLFRKPLRRGKKAFFKGSLMCCLACSVIFLVSLHNLYATQKQPVKKRDPLLV